MRNVLVCLLAIVSLPARVTQTICSVSAQDGETTCELEFVGTGDIALIQVNAPRGARLG